MNANQSPPVSFVSMIEKIPGACRKAKLKDLRYLCCLLLNLPLSCSEMSKTIHNTQQRSPGPLRFHRFLLFKLLPFHNGLHFCFIVVCPFSRTINSEAT